MEQWCAVRGCVALADSPHVPHWCRIHAAMTQLERDDWSREHSFQLPRLRSIMTRIQFRRRDGSEYGYDDDGNKYEIVKGLHAYEGYSRDVDGGKDESPGTVQPSAN